MSKTVIIALIVVGLLIGAVSFAYAQKNKLNKLSGTGEVRISELPNEFVSFPLKVGSKGLAVKSIQSYLAVTDDVKIDGYFGQKTQQASIDYFFSKDGSITEKQFLNTIVLRSLNQVTAVFPIKPGDAISFALQPLQIMLGVPTSMYVDAATSQAIKYFFGKSEVTFGDYKQLAAHVFNLSI